MKLRQLVVSGFKSFADKTAFDFDDGISCIVGPNGCGKSNVVDAIKWVLGEQSAKSLRGSEMMDVIFNGSASRKASGAATVTLVFENSEGLLEIPGSDETADTVSITRRLYRSGQSEYLINNQAARLKDIKEMFLDTGLGTNAYSIIEQGRVTQFLQASQEERRAFFDEAAGISRYKQRKKEALRKLDRVEQNLLRLNDILEEVEKRLRSVKLQAGKARNYQAYRETLDELRSLHFLSRYHVLSGERTEVEGLLAQAVTAQEALQQMIRQLTVAQEAAEVETMEMEQTSRDVQSRIASATSQINALGERANAHAQRAEELAVQLKTHTERIADLEGRIGGVADELKQREAQSQELAARVDEVKLKSTDVFEAYAAGELALTKKSAALQSERSRSADLSRQVTQRLNEWHQLGIRRLSLHDDRVRLEVRGEEIAGELAGLQGQRDEATARHEEALGTLKALETSRDTVRSAFAELGEEEQQLTRTLSETRENRSGLQGKIATLEEMQKRMDGVGEGTRRVLEAKQKGDITSVRGMLGEFIETDSEHAPVVEAALAGADQYLVADRLSDVHAETGAIDALLGKGGSVELLCLDRIAHRPSGSPAPLCEQALGFVLDWVRFDPTMQDAMVQLLGNTVVVATLSDALSAASVSPAHYRFVTQSGELLESDGRLHLGSARSAAGVIGRRSELNELQARCETLAGEIESLQVKSDDTQAQRKSLDEQIQQLQSEVYQATSARTDAEKQQSTLDDQIRRLEGEGPHLRQQLLALWKQIDGVINMEQQRRSQSAECEERKAVCEQASAALGEEMGSLRTAQEGLAEQRTELKVQLASAEQQKLALVDTVRTLRRQHGDMEQQLAESRSAIELDQTRREEAEAETKRCRETIEELAAQKTALVTDAEEVEESRQSLKSRLEEIRTQLHAKRGEADVANKTVGDLRVRFSQLDTQVEDLVSRAQDEMEMDLAELHVGYEHDDERDWDAVEAEIGELRGKIARLGNVNLDAITEQEELEQRETYLHAQLADIAEARQQLEKLIDRLNDECRQRFIATFDTVRQNFQVFFRKLFGGGRADVMLTDPEDVLESGIEIVARPPGKELRSISLLSGGEKTMAALAMIFSFFRSRPSPFCLLDEVDAALDEANTERYNAIVNDFLDDTQFIVISHAKRTMACANVLYGVTMQEPGVSRRISVRFEQASEIVDADAANN